MRAYGHPQPMEEAMFELEEVTPKWRERKDGESPDDSRHGADVAQAEDNPCSPEAGNCNPSAGCNPAAP